MSKVLAIRSLRIPVWLQGKLCFRLALMAAICSSTLARAQERTLDRVEEDWIALIAEPDSATSSPQILNIISPTQSTAGVFGMVQVNHRGEPEFQGGGLQVQGWVGTAISATADAGKTAILFRDFDSLRYTVAMQRTADGIKFELRNGYGRTWGRFARSNVSVTVPTVSASLEQYTPQFSVANTGVNLGKHRVDLLYITETRLTYSDGEIVTDSSDRIAHSYHLNVEDVSLEAYEANPDDYNIDITE